jgi:hypothetical protein
MANKDPNSCAGFARKHGISYRSAAQILSRPSILPDGMDVLIEQAKLSRRKGEIRREGEIPDSPAPESPELSP